MVWLASTVPFGSGESVQVPALQVAVEHSVPPLQSVSLVHWTQLPAPSHFPPVTVAVEHAVFFAVKGCEGPAAPADFVGARIAVVRGDVGSGARGGGAARAVAGGDEAVAGDLRRERRAHRGVVVPHTPELHARFEQSVSVPVQSVATMHSTHAVPLQILPPPHVRRPSRPGATGRRRCTLVVGAGVRVDGDVAVVDDVGRAAGAVALDDLAVARDLGGRGGAGRDGREPAHARGTRTLVAVGVGAGAGRRDETFDADAGAVALGLAAVAARRSRTPSAGVRRRRRCTRLACNRCRRRGGRCRRRP